MWSKKDWDGIRENCIGWECCTYGDKLDQWAREYKDRVALTDENSSLTYSQMRDGINRVAAHFLEMEIKKDQKVLVQLYNSIEYIFAVMGLFKIGAIPVLMLPTQGYYELNGISETARPIAYIGPRRFMETDYKALAERLKEEHKFVKHLIYIDQIREFACDDKADIEKYNFEKPNYKDVAMLLLSGGTTGIPKLIPRTHGDYIYNNKIMAERCKLCGETVFLAVLPAAHNFTWGNPGVLGTFAAGGKAVMCNCPMPMEILRLIEEEKVTFTSMVPALLEMCMDYRNIDKENDLSTLKFIIVGGAMLRQKTAEEADDVMECNLLQIYGTAEGLNCCYFPDDSREKRLSCQGIPISLYDQILIVDEQDRPCPDGRSGELITKGPYTITEYYVNIKANENCFTKDGYYRTGDKAMIMPDGGILIIGRCKEQINRAGEKIMPAEVEECICRHELVDGCAVVGIEDDLVGNKIAAFIKSQDVMTLTEIKDHLKNVGIAQYKMPDVIFNVDDFPYTAVKKIDKKALTRWAQESLKENA